MKKRRMTDDEIRRIARTLHAEGRLNIRNLMALATGETRRLSAFMNEVLAESPEIPLEGDDSANGTAFSEIPASLRGDLSHLHKSIAKAFLSVRDEENKRARQLEAAQAAQHEHELRAEREATAAAEEALEEERQTFAHRAAALTQLSADLQVKTRDLENAHAERRACSDASAREREVAANTLAEAHRNLAAKNIAVQDVELKLTEARVEIERTQAANALLSAEAEAKRVSAEEKAVANETLRGELGRVLSRLESKELEVRELTTRLISMMSMSTEPAGSATGSQPPSATKRGKTRRR